MENINNFEDEMSFDIADWILEEALASEEVGYGVSHMPVDGREHDPLMDERDFAILGASELTGLSPWEENFEDPGPQTEVVRPEHLVLHPDEDLTFARSPAPESSAVNSQATPRFEEQNLNAQSESVIFTDPKDIKIARKAAAKRVLNERKRKARRERLERTNALKDKKSQRGRSIESGRDEDHTLGDLGVLPSIEAGPVEAPMIGSDELLSPSKEVFPIEETMATQPQPPWLVGSGKHPGFVLHGLYEPPAFTRYDDMGMEETILGPSQFDDWYEPNSQGAVDETLTSAPQQQGGNFRQGSPIRQGVVEETSTPPPHHQSEPLCQDPTVGASVAPTPVQDIPAKMQEWWEIESTKLAPFKDHPKKPKYNAYGLIKLALLSKGNIPMAAVEIRQWITDAFAYYRQPQVAWRRLVNSCLKDDDFFVSVDGAGAEMFRLVV